MRHHWTKRTTVGAVLLLLLSIGLIYTFLVQPWHMRWGATDAELTMPLPGDPFIPPTTIVSTRALTIHAPVSQVWAWVVQLGQEHGGFYSYEWLENLFAAQMHNADRIVPAWQHPQVGERVLLMANPPPLSISQIVLMEPERVMVLQGGWTFFVEPIDPQTTRFIVRYASFPLKGNWGAALYYYPLFEPAHFVMEAGMMMGVKQRAEQAARSRISAPNDRLFLSAQEARP